MELELRFETSKKKSHEKNLHTDKDRIICFQKHYRDIEIINEYVAKIIPTRDGLFYFILFLNSNHRKKSYGKKTFTEKRIPTPNIESINASFKREKKKNFFF